jgi:thymidylate synthase
MNNYDKAYIGLTTKVLNEGVRKDDRTGTGTYSIFADEMRVDMREGFPMLTTKKINFKAVKHELLWFLQGGTNIKYLVDNGVNIWNEWPHQHYMRERSKFVGEHRVLTAKIELNNELDKFAESKDPAQDFLDLALAQERLAYVESYLASNPELTVKEFADGIRTNTISQHWGDLGPVYGKQWVDWSGEEENVNQIADVIKALKENPDSRRIMVNAWNVDEINQMLLPPCHYGFQFWTRPYADGTRGLSLLFNMRSVDMFLGMPFDIASYGLLLSMVAHCVDMKPEMLIVHTGDTHVYVNHVEQVKEQATRLDSAYELPKLWLNPDVRDIFSFKPEDIEVLGYESHPPIKAQVSV